MCVSVCVCVFVVCTYICMYGMGRYVMSLLKWTLLQADDRSAFETVT